MKQLSNAVSQSVEDLKRFRQNVDNTNDPRKLERLIDERSQSQSQSQSKSQQLETFSRLNDLNDINIVTNKILNEMDKQFNQISNMLDKQFKLKENKLNRLSNNVLKLKNRLNNVLKMGQKNVKTTRQQEQKQEQEQEEETTRQNRFEKHPNTIEIIQNKRRDDLFIDDNITNTVPQSFILDQVCLSLFYFFFCFFLFFFVFMCVFLVNFCVVVLCGEGSLIRHNIVKIIVYKNIFFNIIVKHHKTDVMLINW